MALGVQRRFSFESFVNDVSLDAAGQRLGLALSESKAERNREVYLREKRGLVEPSRPGDAGAIVDAGTGQVLQRWSSHRGVVATAGISPDGLTLATGGWDKRLVVQSLGGVAGVERTFGWSVRRARFSPDGRLLAVAAWTPPNPLGDQRTEPSAVVFPVEYQPEAGPPPEMP